MMSFPKYDFKFADAGEMIKDLPPIEELTTRELAIHRRGFQEGHTAGWREAVGKATIEFQVTMFGHVL